MYDSTTIIHSSDVIIRAIVSEERPNYALQTLLDMMPVLIIGFVFLLHQISKVKLPEESN